MAVKSVVRVCKCVSIRLFLLRWLRCLLMCRLQRIDWLAVGWCLAQPAGWSGIRNSVPLQSVDTVLLHVLFRNVTATTQPAADTLDTSGLSLSSYHISVCLILDFTNYKLGLHFSLLLCSTFILTQKLLKIQFWGTQRNMEQLQRSWPTKQKSEVVSNSSSSSSSSSSIWVVLAI